MIKIQESKISDLYVSVHKALIEGYEFEKNELPYFENGNYIVQLKFINSFYKSNMIQFLKSYLILNIFKSLETNKNDRLSALGIEDNSEDIIIQHALNFENNKNLYFKNLVIDNNMIVVKNKKIFDF